MAQDISTAVQSEVARIRDIIATTKALLPKGNVNFAFYELILRTADQAIREQDTVTLVKILPELQEMQ